MSLTRSSDEATLQLILQQGNCRADCVELTSPLRLYHPLSRCRLVQYDQSHIIVALFNCVGSVAAPLVFPCMHQPLVLPSRLQLQNAAPHYSKYCTRQESYVSAICLCVCVFLQNRTWGFQRQFPV